MTPEQRRAQAELVVEASDPDALFMDGLDAAIIGTASQGPSHLHPVYSRALILAALRAQGMDQEDAQEHLAYNIEGAWVGECTPLIYEPLEGLAECGTHQALEGPED